METTTYAPTRIATCMKACTVLTTTALAVTVAMFGTGHTVNTFMWIRGLLLPAAAVLLYRLSVAAAGGSGHSSARLRTLTRIMPIAVIVVDLIPGICPLWYAGLQTLCMVPVIVAAVTLHAPAFRTASPEAR